MAYKARHRDDLIAGLDEFLNEVTVLPPGEWDPKIRIEPPKKVPSAEMRYQDMTYVQLIWYNLVLNICIDHKKLKIAKQVRKIKLFFILLQKVSVFTK